jgi:glycosyltransferase involved in cell wall biosynthesis
LTYDIEVVRPLSKELIEPQRIGMSSVSVVIAALNEEEGIAPTICEMQKELGEPQIIVVDGKSTDHTVDIAKDLGAEIFFQKREGKGDAISEGLKYVKEDSEYVIFTDADFTYPARHVKDMVAVLDSNPQVGMVLGNRFSQLYKTESDRNQFYIGNLILNFCQLVFNGVNLNDPFTGLRIIRYDLLKDWRPKSLGFDIEAEINHHVIKNGYKISEIPIKYRKRLGKKKLGFRHGLEILQRIVLL